MNRIRLTLLVFGCGVALLGATCGALAAQDPLSTRSLVFNVSSLNGVPLHGAARGVEGLDYSAGASVGTVDGRAVLHRIVLDRSHHMYFGYDLIAIPSEVSHTVHLHFQPMVGLNGFNIDPAVFRHVELTLPADATISEETPFDVPLETDARGGVILRDRLSFGPR